MFSTLETLVLLQHLVENSALTVPVIKSELCQFFKPVASSPLSLSLSLFIYYCHALFSTSCAFFPSSFPALPVRLTYFICSERSVAAPISRKLSAQMNMNECEQDLRVARVVGGRGSSSVCGMEKTGSERPLLVTNTSVHVERFVTILSFAVVLYFRSCSIRRRDP